MGLLDYALAFIDARKRYVANTARDVMADPVQGLGLLGARMGDTLKQGAADVRNNTDAAFSVMPQVQEQGINGLINNGMNLGGLLGMTAWHGSPHKFDKFDMSKIGTGEGAQAYGHGLYFAENPEVAKGYSRLGDSFVSMDGTPVQATTTATYATPQNRAAAALVRFPNDKKAALDWIGPNDIEARKVIRNTKSVEPVTGHTYKVDIPDEAVGKMLDWDKPLSQQPKAVQDALHKGWLAHPDTDSKMTGAQIYQRAGITLTGKEGTQAAAEQLRALGIPGIRYLDAGSRGTGGTSNFVVFDDKLPKIISRE